MKKILLLFILLTAKIVSGAVIEEQKILLDIKDDSSIDWTINIEYPDYVSDSDYFVLATISDVEVFGENGRLECKVESREIGTSIVCNNIHEKNVTYRFTAYNLIEVGRRIRIFSYKFPITNIIESFELIVKIPLGMAIIEEERLEYTGLKPFIPENGREGSDGRRIFVKWFFDQPKLGETIEVSVIHEQISVVAQPWFLYISGIGTLVLIFIAFFLFYRKRSSINRVLPILNEAERKVMKVVLESKGIVDQRKIVKDTDFSKSKVSRIVKNLEERGLIKREKRGRSTKIKLVFGETKSTTPSK